MNKKVSIIMGIYNCESTIRECIDSIINQTYENWELIICDDCSRDDTFKIAKEYENKYQSKIKLFKNETNITLAPTLNRCIEFVTGDYIARQDGDDISIRDRLEKQVEFLNNNKEYDLVGTAMLAFDENGEKGIRSIGVQIPNKNTLAYTVPFCHATIMARTSVYKRLAGYRVVDYTTRCEDADLWFRFFKAGFKGYNLDQALYKVRDDHDAYKRRTLINYYNLFRVNLNGFRLVNMPLKYYIYLAKPIISAIIPSFFMKYYHKNKLA